MDIKDAEVGRKVIYTPYRGCDAKLKEEGVITSFNKKYIFVRYGSQTASLATEPSDLKYL